MTKMLKRKKPLLRSKRSGLFAHGSRRCGICKLGDVEDSPGPVDVTIGGETYPIQVDRRMACTRCGATFVHDRDRASATAEASGRHRERVLERDDWTCRRCGCSGIPLEVAHVVGKSRARNPGPERDLLENLEACCIPCHRAEHGG